MLFQDNITEIYFPKNKTSVSKFVHLATLFAIEIYSSSFKISLQYEVKNKQNDFN
jgi:hypothetical protein